MELYLVENKDKRKCLPEEDYGGESIVLLENYSLLKPIRLLTQSMITSFVVHKKEQNLRWEVE